MQGEVGRGLAQTEAEERLSGLVSELLGLRLLLDSVFDV